MQAAGRMGWSQDEFWLSTPRFFQNAFFGWREQKKEEHIEGLRRTRLVAFYSLLPHMKKGAMRRPEDLYYLSGDADTLEAIEQRIKGEREYMAQVLKVAKTIDVFKGETMPKTIPEA